MVGMALVLLAAVPKIAVLDVRTGPGVDAALAPYLTQIIAKEVADRTGAAPLVSADIAAMLGFEKKKQMLGCSEEDSSCLAEITGALGVQRVVATSVSTSGGRYLVTMSLIDSQKARPLARDAESSPLDDDDLVKALRWSAYRVFGGAPPTAPLSPPPPPWTRRSWSWVAAGGALALAAGGAILGATALSAAKSGDTGARPRAHVADALVAGAAVCTGAAIYLRLSDRPAAMASLGWRFCWPPRGAAKSSQPRSPRPPWAAPSSSTTSSRGPSAATRFP